MTCRDYPQWQSWEVRVWHLTGRSAPYPSAPHPGARLTTATTGNGLGPPHHTDGETGCHAREAESQPPNQTLGTHVRLLPRAIARPRRGEVAYTDPLRVTFPGPRVFTTPGAFSCQDFSLEMFRCAKSLFLHRRREYFQPVVRQLSKDVASEGLTE